MSDNIHDNKFKEELEKELESGLNGSADNADDDDFTVRVKREEYIVKRRFYDKDKALEAAETLRQDKRNLVEDNIEGQAFTVEEEDEKVDWDKLVDAGLEFDPPIALAAEKPPGELPVGFSDHEPNLDMDNQVLETTLLVKRPKKEKPQVEEPDEDVEFEGEEVQEEVSSKKSGMPWIVLALIVLCVAGGAYYYLSRGTPQPDSAPRQAVTFQKMKTSPMPSRPAVPVQTPEPVEPPAPVDKKPVVAEKPVPDTAPAPVAEPPAPVVSEKQPPRPVKTPEPPAPEKEAVAVMDHFTHTVHVSSYRSVDRALAAVVKLKKKGFEAFSGTISIPGKGEWHRIFVGYLQDLDSAKALSERIKKETREDAVARKAPRAIQVGDAAPLSQLKAVLPELSQKGYAASAVPVSKGSDMGRILIGAFKTDAEAATMLANMKKDGFAVKVVLR